VATPVRRMRAIALRAAVQQQRQENPNVVAHQPAWTKHLPIKSVPDGGGITTGRYRPSTRKSQWRRGRLVAFGHAEKNGGRPISPGSDGRALYARPVRYAPWLRPCHTFYRDGSAFGWWYQWRGGTNRPGVTTTAISLAPSPYGYRS
jgi:hypothetical protein